MMKRESKCREYSLVKQDLLLPSKVYSADRLPPSEIKILKKKKIGAGAQGKVYKIEIQFKPGFYVDKVPIFLNNPKNVDEAYKIGN